jgi:hypothetical protein
VRHSPLLRLQTTTDSPSQTGRSAAAAYRTIGALLLGLTLLRGLLYTVLVPPWQAPDEPGHFEYAWAIARRGGPPTDLHDWGAILAWLRDLPRAGAAPVVQSARPAFEQALLDSLYDSGFFEYRRWPLPDPPLRSLDQLNLGRTLPGERFSTAYVWQGMFIALSRTGALLDQLYLARLSSVVLNLLIVALGLATARTIVPDRPALALAVGITLVLWPQHTFINATVSDGPLAELGATLAIYGWARLLSQKSSLVGTLAIIGGTLLGLSAKANAAYLLGLHPVLLVVYTATAIRRRPLAALLAMAALAGGLWSVYQVDLVSLNRIRAVVEVLRRQPILEPGIGDRLAKRPWWWVFDSYWGFFGWMHIRVFDDWYRILYCLTALGAVGWAVPRWGFVRLRAGHLALMAAAPALAIVTLVLFVLYVEPSYLQGRYLFTASVPTALLLTLGWARLVPARWERWFLPGLGLVLGCLDLVASWAWLTFFYP